MASRHTMSRDRLQELQGDDNNRYGDYPPPPPPAQTRYNNTPPLPSPGRYDDNRYNQRQNDRYGQETYTPPPPRQVYNQTPPRGASGRANYANGGSDYELKPVGGAGDFSNSQDFFNEVDSIRADIDRVNESIARIQELHSSSLGNINDDQAAQTERQIDQIKSQTQKQNAKIKDRIKSIEIANARMNSNSPDLQMRKTQHAALKKRFMETIQKYSDTERNFSKKYRQRMERQIRIVKPEASQDEIEDIIDSDHPQIFAQSLLNSNRSGQARAVLAEVQNRQDDIKKIEKTILELHQLFVEMNQLVEAQGEMINNVEQHAEETVIALEDGNKYIDKAVVSAKSARAKKWWCLLITLLIIIVVVALVYFLFIKPNMAACGKALC